MSLFRLRLPDRIARTPTVGGARRAAGAAPRAVEFAAVAVLAVAAAKIFGAWFWPLPVSATPAGAAPPRNEAPVAIINPFRAPLVQAGSVEQAAAGVIEAARTDLNLTLYGTWIDAKGVTATIGQGDGAQKVFAIGEDICCGAKLEKVFPSYVLINRGGAIESLRLANTADGDGPVVELQAAPAAQQTQASVSGLDRMIALAPTISPTGKVEFAITPVGDPDLLERFGLQPNDVLVSVNGRAAPATADQIPGFFSALRDETKFKVVVRRSGATQTVDIASPLAARGEEG